MAKSALNTIVMVTQKAIIMRTIPPLDPFAFGSLD